MERLRWSGLVGDAALLSMATAVSQGLGIAGFTLAAAWAPVDEMGVYVVFLACHSLLERVTSLAYPLALPNLAEDEAPTAVAAIGAVLVAASAVIGLGCVLWQPAYAAPMAVACLAGGAIRAQRMLRVRAQDYRLLAAMTIGPNLCLMAAVSFGPIVADDASAFLINAHTASVALTALATAAIVHRRTGFRFVWPRTREIVGFLRRHKSYPLLVAPAELCNAAAVSLPTLLLQAWFPGGNALAAQYALCRRVGFAPMSTIGQGISRTLHGRLTAAARDRSGDYLATYRHLRRWLAVLGAGAAIGFAWLGPTIVRWAFGSDWELACQFLRILAPAFGLTLAAAPLGVVFFASEAHRTHLQTQLMILAASAGSMAIGALFGDIVVAVTLMSILLSLRFLWMLRQTDRLAFDESTRLASHNDSAPPLASAQAA